VAFQDGNLIFKDINTIPTSIKKFKEGFLIGTNNGLYFYNGSLNKIDILSNKSITDMISDQFNSVFVLTNDGLYRLNENLDRILEFHLISGKTFIQATNFPILHPLSIYNDTLLLVGSSEGVGLIRINSLIEENVFLYPNPARDTIRIKNLKGSYEYRVYILTLSGKLKKNLLVKSSSSGEIIIDISDLEKGLYILRISNKNLKFVKN
jgi:hypothetical protein